MKHASWIKALILAVFLIVAFQPVVIAETVKAERALDAVVTWGNGKAYFFKGNQYVRFDMKAMRVDSGYPKSVSEWRGLWPDGIDAAFNLGNGKVYFFKGDQYIRWDIAADSMDSGYPKLISAPTAWPGFPWMSGFDSVICMNQENGKLYFFKGSEYVRYDIKTDHSDPGYPKPISTPTAWPGLPWTDGFDTAVNWGNGKLFFFKGNEYVQYDLKTDRADPGYPQRITQLNWPGLAGLLHEIVY